MLTIEHVRDLVYAGPSEVIEELGDRPQHLLRCNCGVGDTEQPNERENGERVARYHSGLGNGQSKG